MMACCITGKSKPTGAMFEDQNMISGDDNNDNNDTDSVSIAVPIMPMIMASQMIYEYADIRKIVLDQDVSFNRDLNFLQRWRKGVVTFRDVELISVRAETDVDGDGNRNFKGTHLQRTVRAEELLQFVQQNRKYFYSIPIDTRGYVGFDRRGTNDVPLNIEISLETYIEAHSHASADADADADAGEGHDPVEVIELDDEYAQEELVFSILLNRIEKRIVVVFRGSRTVEDWRVNVDVRGDTVDVFQEFVANDSNVKIHGGYAEYLYGPSREEGKSKFDQIVYILQQVYQVEEYRDYQLFTTGHSLGGSLANILAFGLAGSSLASFIPKPIIGITTGAFVTGNRDYYNEFKLLEEAGKLRYIRVSNDGDVVTNEIFYKHNGLNLNVFEGKVMDIGYGNVRDRRGGEIIQHDFSYYYKNVFQKKNAEILRKSVEELYEEYSGLVQVPLPGPASV